MRTSKCTLEKIFFFGAGFSKAVDSSYPSLLELSHAINDDMSKGFLAEYYKKIYSNFENNIEALLTYLFMDLPWKTEYSIALDKAVFTDIALCIQTHFNARELFYQEKNERDEIRTLADFIIKNKSCCLTLNYDTLLEKIIFSKFPQEYQKSNGYEGFYKIPMQSVNDRWVVRKAFGFASGHEDYKGEKLPYVLKMHGSINWLWAGMTPSDPIYCAGKNESILYDEGTSGLKPFIIPPVLDKNRFYNNNILQSIWQTAFRYLTLSFNEELYIIGFSFPESDVSIKYFFKRIISERKNDYDKFKIYVVNTDTSDKLKDRYRDIFPKKILNFDYCCENALKIFTYEKLKNK